MQKESVLQLIDEKLQQIEEAEKANFWNGKISYGVHQNVYKDSPYMPRFLKKRKGLNRAILIQAFLIPVMVLSFSYDWLEESLWKTIIKILLNALFIGGIFIYSFLRSMVQHANNAQLEVKRLMLHDLRQKVAAMEEVREPESWHKV